MTSDPNASAASQYVVATPTERNPATPAVGSGVVDNEGLFGTVVSAHELESGTGAGLANMVVVRHREQQVMLPVSVFSAVSATSFSIPFAFNALIAQGDVGGNLVLPVLQEEMHVGKRLVDTGRGVRVHKTILDTTHESEQTLLREELTVDRVAIGTWVDPDKVPVTRQEGDTLIVPVIEEVPVVQIRLRLKEEVRITRTSRSVREVLSVALKSEEVQVERFDSNLQPDGGAGETEAYDRPTL